MPSHPDPRPALTPALERLLVGIVDATPELAGLSTRDILVVAAGAHGTAAASVRSLDGCARTIKIDGYARRTELVLRPPFFLGGDPVRRLTTLVHELLHLDPRRPGALLDAHRHRVRSHDDHEDHARALARAWLSHGDVDLLAPLGHHGELLMRQWKHRPVPETRERAFTGRDVFVAPVIMHTPSRHRSTWW